MEHIFNDMKLIWIIHPSETYWYSSYFHKEMFSIFLTAPGVKNIWINELETSSSILIPTVDTIYYK